MIPHPTARNDAQPLLTREVFGNVSETSQCVFYMLAVAALAVFVYGVYRRARLWRLGTPGGNIAWRGMAQRGLRNVLLQRRMITRPGASVAHRMFFSGFAVLLVGTILIGIEHWLADLLGRDPQNPVFHKGLYYAIYEVVLDLFGVAMLAGGGLLLWRRMRSDASIGHAPSDGIVLGSFLAIGITGYLLEGLRIVFAQTPLPGLSLVGYLCAALFRASGVGVPAGAAAHFVVWWLHA